MLVNLYSKPNCMACNQSKRLLDKLDIDYTEAPITDEVMEFAKKRGITQAPIVVIYHVGDTINDAAAWGGFRPEKIKHLAQER